MVLTPANLGYDVSTDPIPMPDYVREAPMDTRAWTPEANNIRLRATGVPSAPVYTYMGPGNAHQVVVGPGPARAYVVDISGHDNDPWFVVSVLAYGFFDLAYRETIRYQRRHVWKVARVQ